MTLLSDVVVARTYSKVKADGTKESWNDICDRYQQELEGKYPQLTELIVRAVELVRLQRITPSMRFLQFAMSGIKLENMRGYNCAFVSVRSFKDIADILYISMCGTGMGFSVKKYDIGHLPVIRLFKEYTLPVLDSKEGWSQSVIRLLENPMVQFDYSQIRKQGESLSTGGTASGPEPLILAHQKVRNILMVAVGRKLTPIEVHGIVTHLADAVVVGGVRRSALISLFDKDEVDMLESKSNDWWIKNPNFARSNNSVQLNRNTATQQEFNAILDQCFESQAGEPGISWTNTESGWGYNPCAEISLRSHGTCNLTEINFSKCETRDDFFLAAWFATFLGTLQAGFTDFNYISSAWTNTVKADALLGVSITGIAHNWKLMQSIIADGSLRECAESLPHTNRLIASAIGINPAKRITTIKPSGTTSCVLDTTSGIHAAHAPYYIRRVRIDKTDPVAKYLATILGAPYLEEDLFNKSNVILAVPYKMENAIFRKDETALQQLERAASIYHNWVLPGHVSGDNPNNVSLTCSYDEDEREQIKAWMWYNRDSYGGVSLLPRFDHSYVQAPFEEITEDRYNELVANLPAVDLSDVVYTIQDDTRSGEVACSGGSCEIK